MKLSVLFLLLIVVIAGCTQLTVFSPPTGQDGITIYEVTCDLECEKYRYGTCPSGCLERCTPSSCSGNMCTTDCGGPGSCYCPISLDDVNFFSCEQDSDCIEVDGGCCGCNAGGKATTINKNFRTEWQKNLLKQCEETACLTVISNDPSCFKEPKCIDNICILV